MGPFLYFNAASYYISLYINEKCYSLKLNTFITVILTFHSFVLNSFIIILKFNSQEY